jgi:hypothetical protein
MYNNGVRIEKIAKLLGHSNTNTTLLYIGVDLDDMSDALKKGANFRQKKTEAGGDAKKASGPKKRTTPKRR